MPEGPEVWILSKAINQYYKSEISKTMSIGKHLIVNDVNENWSFGLTGKVSITDCEKLIKLNTGWIYGDTTCFSDYSNVTDKLGLDWFTSSKEELEKEVNTWTKSKKKLAALILDQSKICGIGVAWGSEILFKAKLRPDKTACNQPLNNLVEIMIEVRENIKIVYEKVLEKMENKEFLKQFINGWFENLYKIREMNVYKKGDKIKILGRNWWISTLTL